MRKRHKDKQNKVHSSETLVGMIKDTYSPNLNNVIIYGYYFRMIFVLCTAFTHISRLPNFSSFEYVVLTDGAQQIMKGNSPYQRTTFRHSPILAFLMILNRKYWHGFGKLFYCMCDIITALTLRNILKKTVQLSKDNRQYLIMFWLFNPLIVYISVRGYQDSLIVMLVICVVTLLMHRKITFAGIFFGLAMHFKLYPVIYYVPFFLWIDTNKLNRGVLTRNRMKFVFFSLLTFGLLLWFFYMQYGWIYIKQVYLYEFQRKDIRENISVYFYYFYLNYEHMNYLHHLMSVLPQMLIVLLCGIKMFKDLPFCMFIQTYSYVMFNKMISVQYFMWFMVFFSLVFSRNILYKSDKLYPKLVKLVLGWIAISTFWKFMEYLLEKAGYNMFFELWVVSLGFFALNSYIILSFIKNQPEGEFKILRKIRK